MLLTEGEGYLGTSGYDGPGAARLVGDKAFGGSGQIDRDFGSGARGGSIFDIINDSNYIRNQPIFWEHEGNCAVRWGKYKLVKRYPRPWELYDINNDRTELNNIIKSNKKIADKLISMYKKWAVENEIMDILN